MVECRNSDELFDFIASELVRLEPEDVRHVPAVRVALRRQVGDRDGAGNQTRRLSRRNARAAWSRCDDGDACAELKVR